MATLPRRSGPRPAAHALAVLSLLLSPGCSCDDGGGAPAPDDGPLFEVEYELFPTTKPMEEEELASLVAVSADGAVFEFAAPLPEQVASLAPRDVIVGGLSPLTPKGFLRAVHHLEPVAGGGVRVHTVETSPAWAFRKLDLRVRDTLVVGGEAPATAHGALRQPLGLSASLPFDRIVYDGDGDEETTEDQIRIEGELTPRVWFDLDLDIEWPDSVLDVLVPIDPLDPFSLPADVKVVASLATSAGAGARLHMYGVSGLHLSQDIGLGEFPLGTIPAPTPFFVVVVNLELVARVDGGTSASFDTGLQGDTGDFGFRVTVDSEGDESGFELIEPHPSFQVDTPVIDSRASARLKVGPRINALIWDLVGPQVGLSAVARLEADNLRTPCWSLDAGFEAEVGIKVRPLIDETWGIPLVDTHVSDGACELPPDAGTDVLPTFTPWAKAYGDMAFSSGEWTDLTLVHDGRWLIAGDMGRALAKVTAEGNLVWAREYHRIEPVNGNRTPLYVQHVEPTLAGGLIAAAHPPTFVALDLAGRVRWARKASLVHHGSLRLNGGIVELAGGSLLAASVFEPADGADDDAVLLRIAPDGKLLDARTWGIEGREEVPVAIARWGDGWVVMGRTQAPVGVEMPGWLLELDGAGDPVRAWIVSAGDRAVTLDAGRALEDGGFLLGGSVDRPGGHAAILLKLRADRSVAWTRAIDTSAGFGFRLTAVTQNPLGYLLAAGTLDDYFEDTWIASLDTAGRVDWLRVIDGDGAAVEAPAIAATEDHGVLVAVQQEVTDPDGFAMLKVWRKDGRVTFRDGTGFEQRDLAVDEEDPHLGFDPVQADLGAVAVPWEPVELVVTSPDETAQVDLAP